MAYLIAGPMVALIGIVAVFFVLRRKSVDKRSMYSARRSQIEHKVRAARQRTLTPRGRSERRHEEQTVAATAAFAPAEVQQTVTYDAPAYTAPPVAPPAPVQPAAPPPWETTSAPEPAAAPSYDYPAAAPAAPVEPAWNPPAPEPFQPAPEPTPRPTPSEPAWTPAPAPAAEPVAPLEPVTATASSSSTAAGWSVVNTEKDGSVSEQADGGKKKGGGDTGSWQLASGEAPGEEADEPQVKRPNNLMAIAQYAVLVVGLVMVLIGVMVMLANSHVT